MGYLPKNQYQVKNTKGGEYKLVNSSTSYKGPFILLNDGQVFAGDSPERSKGRLIPIKNPTKHKNINYSPANNRVYDVLKPKLSQQIGNFNKIPSSSPIPNAVDYSNGYFFRYIVVKLNTKTYLETSKTVFQNWNEKYNFLLYKIFPIKWSLKENNEEINIEHLRKLESYAPGIFNFFPDKKQYGLKNGVIYLSNFNRIYPNGENIPKVLPAAYQRGNEHPNTITNKNVPTFEHCKTCAFFMMGECSKWQAPAKAEYWCRAYEMKKNTPTPPSTSTTSVDSLISAKQDNPPPQKSSTFTRRGGSY